MHFRDSKLYACGAEGGNVAGLVRWDRSGMAITWVNPGGRQRAYVVRQLVADNAHRFEFVDTRGRRFVLERLTARFYNESIRRARARRLMTSAQLLAAFEKSLG